MNQPFDFAQGRPFDILPQKNRAAYQTVRGEPVEPRAEGKFELILPPLREGAFPGRRGRVMRFTLSFTLPLKGEGMKSESALRLAQGRPCEEY